MRKLMVMLVAVGMVSSCGNKQEQKVKAPTRVKTEVVSTAMNASGQTYVGMIEER